jgi:hypothetical protein
LLLGLSALAGCQAQPFEASAASAADAEAALLARIRGEIGAARCDSDAQCRTLAIGEKACGGPEQWLAWSVTTGRAERLQAWAAELAALQRQRQQAAGMMSNCAYNADPGALCQAQRCVARSRAVAR